MSPNQSPTPSRNDLPAKVASVPGRSSRHHELTSSIIPLSRAHEIETPALIIDLDVVERNLDSMQSRASRNGVSLRPHVKSHKIPALARMQIRAGAVGIAVAKLGEAEVMTNARISGDDPPDIFIANQIIGPTKLERLRSLAHKARLSVGIDSVASAAALATAFSAEPPGQGVPSGLTTRARPADPTLGPLPVLIEVDCGLGRCGVCPGPPVVRLARELRALDGIRLAGLFTHAGQAYSASCRDQVVAISAHESRCLVESADLLAELLGHAVATVSVGSTPTIKVWEGCDGVTELRPGNYIFHDAMQLALGTAEPSECALTVLATVISRPTPHRAVIDAGSKVLALDRGAHGNDMIRDHGLVCGSRARVVRLSEEHGILDVAENDPLAIGDRLRIIPNHACPVINLADSAVAVRSGEPAGTLQIAARGMVK